MILNGVDHDKKTYSWASRTPPHAQGIVNRISWDPVPIPNPPLTWWGRGGGRVGIDDIFAAHSAGVLDALGLRLGAQIPTRCHSATLSYLIKCQILPNCVIWESGDYPRYCLQWVRAELRHKFDSMVWSA
ncbi:hypothetical protein BKA83DRAFT_4123333 [Pisolithus microcarpus]|nr:hypothetical protein BKA83DRAFT_4132783 [Pisolithus microcarpus]KAI6020471.1 hypothetical protein BKA83DRAFT_4127164 [Pisolithus microcarpus]KAI6029956.1 hypothetical protein BKA83DRAFT_4123333 [Pisolithus microcarpus]